MVNTDGTISNSLHVNPNDVQRPSARSYDVLPGVKPPKVAVNIEWVQKGVGWDCREVYYTGKQRRRRHLGHLGNQKWQEMQRDFQGAELEQKIREWIDARRADKEQETPKD
jgi:hypothetical protein